MPYRDVDPRIFWDEVPVDVVVSCGRAERHWNRRKYS